jgi:hypothetical protein
MVRFTAARASKEFMKSLADPDNFGIVPQLKGALELLEKGELDDALKRSYPDYPSFEKTLRELWKERTTGIPHPHRWAWKMAPNQKEFIRTCLTCGRVVRMPR